MLVARHESSSRIRRIRLMYDMYGYADASLLYEQGYTKILCSVTLQPGVPSFLRNKGTGWLTAEYAMLPAATQRRTYRESSQAARNSRSVEISRLIGRSLRSVVDLNPLGERTIHVDCDVLQADGGTRVASITAACCALQVAIERWIHVGFLQTSILKEPIAAISVGMSNGEAILDLNAQKDMNAQADFNFVISKSGKIIEIQGTAEKQPMAWEHFEILKQSALAGVQEMFKQCAEFEYKIEHKKVMHLIKQRTSASAKPAKSHKAKEGKVPFFSLANR